LNTHNKNSASKAFSPVVRVLGTALIAVFLIVASELASYITLRFVIVPKYGWMLYVPPDTDPDLYEDYLEHRHPVLSWATATDERRYSASQESRPNPNFPNADKTCVSTYGDSFTYGAEVNDHEAWANVLSGMLNCKVTNFGARGYGTDQAYLRYTLNNEDTAPINILGIYPYNVMRNVNQYRPFLAGRLASFISLKPRFVIEDDDLLLIPPPYFTHEKLVEVIKSPSASNFPHETFLPGSKYGPPVMKFPYTIVMLRLLRSVSKASVFGKEPVWVDYLEENHASKAMEITDKIVTKFNELARERGNTTLVLIYPTVTSYKMFIKSGETATQPLSDMLHRKSMKHIDLHHGLYEYLGDRDYCELLTQQANCLGHYNAEGNRVVAALLKQEISSIQGQKLEP